MTRPKWKLNELIPILSKRGFWDTFYVLINSTNHSISYLKFNKKLNDFSYYNSFSRIKTILIDKGIVEIDRINGKKTITLTKKGIEIHKKLLEIEYLLNHN